MPTQTTPHTATNQNVNTAVDDLEPNQNPQDAGRGEDAALYENAEGAQTGGTRSFHVTDTRDNQPNSIDEGAGLTGGGSGNEKLPQAGQEGITNHPAEERARQEKVVNS